MRRYDIMFATIDSLRSEESLRPGDPHSRAMVEFKEKEETERESVFTFSPRSRRPAPPRCCPKMTSAPMIKKSPQMERWHWLVAVFGCQLVTGQPPLPGGHGLPQASSCRHLGS